MNIIKGICNYLIWWFTAITGGFVISLFFILLMCIGLPLYFLLYVITAPLDYMPQDPIGHEDSWVDTIINYFIKYMGSKPFKR